MKVYIIYKIWGSWGERELVRVFSTREKAINYIADRIIERDDIIENNLDKIKAELQEDLCTFPKYYRGYEYKVE